MSKFMATTNFNNNITWLLLRASMVSKQRLMKTSDEYDLAPMQALTLCLLEPEQTVAMSLIADLLVCDPSNVTGIVERLVAGGYIERRECATDRRVKTISLTEAGLKLRLELLYKIIQNDATNLADLNDTEVETLKNLLMRTLPKASHTKLYPAAVKQTVTK